MANAGAHTNRTQFFITFKPCEHLDRKHSVFGVVIQGLEVLKSMEKVPTDEKDRPIHEITIVDTEVIDNPVKEAEEVEKKRFEAKADARKGTDNSQSTSTEISKEKNPPPEKKSRIGKYLPKAAVTSTAAAAAENTKQDDIVGGGLGLPGSSVAKKTKPAKMKFGNFSGW
jgi:peptidyl-prolyl cis-trans isomerase-like protein 2